jgi:putative sterol carrier protein
MKSQALLESLANQLKDSASPLRTKYSSVNASCLIELQGTSGQEKKKWLLMLTPEKSAVEELAQTEPEGKFDARISMKDEDFYALASGSLSGQRAYMTGKMKIKGNMMLVGKLEPVLKAGMKAKL